MPRQLKAGLFFCICGLTIAYVFATLWVDYQYARPIGYDYLVLNIINLQRADAELFMQVCLTFLVLGMVGFAFGAHFASEALTKEGRSSWQTKAQMWRNKLLGKPGNGFILAKTTGPKSRGRYVTSDKHPNCLIVAPTGAGKGIGFVYPNLLSFEGSTVTLDIKGENYDTTARWRAKKGDDVYRFAPAEFEGFSHRYNPLERIGKLKSYDQINFELRKIGKLFLQADGAGEWLNGAIQLFCAMGGVAYERGDFTLGGIYKVLASGDKDLPAHILNLRKSAKEPALEQELAALSKLESRTLSSYMSVLSNAGFDEWSNSHIADMTSRSDFSFADIRRKKMSIFFVVSDGDLGPMAGLVRLFFNELVATIQANKPKRDEPFPVMIILDEFHLLGKMSKVADAMTTIRGFNGRIAIITQTIPKLDVIYSYEERLSIQGGAGLKLYMTPSEEMTIEDLSKACGMTTKRTITRTRSTGLDERTTISEKTDERPLLTEDEARRLPEDVSIIIVKGAQPLKVKSIRHFEDRHFKSILEQQAMIPWSLVDGDKQSRRIDKLEANADRSQKQTDQRITRTEVDYDAVKKLINNLVDVQDKATDLKDETPARTNQIDTTAVPVKRTVEVKSKAIGKNVPRVKGLDDASAEDQPAGDKGQPIKKPPPAKDGDGLEAA